jgi:hypothetical protein
MDTKRALVVQQFSHKNGFTADTTTSVCMVGIDMSPKTVAHKESACGAAVIVTSAMVVTSGGSNNNTAAIKD